MAAHRLPLARVAINYLPHAIRLRLRSSFFQIQLNLLADARDRAQMQARGKAKSVARRILQVPQQPPSFPVDRRAQMSRAAALERLLTRFVVREQAQVQPRPQ